MINSAQKLFEILSSFKALGQRLPVKTAFENVFSNAGTVKACHERLIFIGNLGRDVESKIRSIPGLDYDLYLRWIPNLDILLENSNLDRSLGDCSRAWAPEVLTYLEFCSRAITQAGLGTQKVPRESLDDIYRKIFDLRSAISDTDELSSEAKSYILKVISRLEEVIRECDLIDNLDVRLAIARAYMEITSVEKPDANNIIGKILGVLKSFNDVFTAGQNAGTLAAGVTFALEVLK